MILIGHRNIIADIIVIIFLSSLIILFSVIPLLADEYDVHISGGIEKVGAKEIDNIKYFSMSDLASVLGERISWEDVGFSARFESDDFNALFYFDSPYININDTVKNIVYPVSFEKGELYLPALTFIPLLDNMRPEVITWDDDKKSIRIDSEYYTVTDLAFSPKANGLLAEIFLSKPMEYEIYLSEGNWMNISIPGGKINRRKILLKSDRRYIRDMQAEQFEKSAQISFRFKKKIGRFTHRYQSNPGRIQISLVDSAGSNMIIRDPVDFGLDNRIDKIVIDAGHGGKDYGAVGHSKTREKKIVLDIAKRLAKLIRKEKIFKVVMTREKDKYVSLDDRTRIANDAQGDLFISIHANASTKRSVRGFQVFFLAPALNDESRALAQLENAPFMTEMNAYRMHQDDDLSYILSDMIQTEFQAESADLAGMIDRECRKNLSKKTRARGIDQAGFYVLNGVFMPSILVESAFITNNNDEKLLNKKDYRQKIAESIYAGLKRFKAKYEKN